jgi:hypothetical protein
MARPRDGLQSVRAPAVGGCLGLVSLWPSTLPPRQLNGGVRKVQRKFTEKADQQHLVPQLGLVKWFGSPTISPLRSECLDNLSPQPGTSEVISQVERYNSRDMKIAAGLFCTAI